MAAVAAVVVLLAGCTSDDGGDGEDKPVPAPGGGSITETIAPVEAPTTDAVTLNDPSEVGDGVTISLAKVETVTVEANGPGEIAGTALAVTVEVANDSGKSLDVGSSSVTLLDGAGAAGMATMAEPAAPLEGSVDSGKSVTGVYVFGMGDAVTNPVTVTVSYGPGAPVAVFQGEAK